MSSFLWRGAKPSLTALAEEIAGGGRAAAGRADARSRPARRRRPHRAPNSQSRDLEPRYVVNNAGFGLVGPAAALDRDEQLAMIDLNVRALTELSLAFVDSLARPSRRHSQRRFDRGISAGPGMAVYYATKAYVLSFSEALHVRIGAARRAGHGALPGTGRHRLPGARRDSPQAASARRGLLALSARRVAKIGYDGFMRGKRVVIAGFGNKIAVFFMRLLAECAGCCRSLPAACAYAADKPARRRDRYLHEARPIRLVMQQPILIILHQEHSTPGRVGNALRQLGYPLDVRRPRFDDPLPATMARARRRDHLRRPDERQ